ncbi:hypothetical protein SAMN05444920_12743 [Nonomuraea solani]|uniref:Uncharacterized protein n=1 Tax=Nonomuraea solani TaxID=1144553 RepID=A0A1H6F053_9ACTN|nr:hypothetical protein [Nonomuraea solani]SEH02505.1 hypothetical protein SAMN05444920_12743 [Nonomuraea solani]
MAEYIEVRTTIEGHVRAAELAHGILRAGLATSIDIAEVPHPHDGATWELTLITTQPQVTTLERHIREGGANRPIISEPDAYDFDRHPDWLIDGQ